MSSISMKRAGELLRSVFKILWDKPEGLTAKEVLSLIPKVVRLTEDELRYSPETNSLYYETIVRIATMPVVYAGWLIKNDKGRWRITENGYQACGGFGNAQDFYNEAMQIYTARRWVAPESIMVMEIAQETAWTEIEKHLHQLSHIKLQTMLAELLRVMGYHPSWMAPPEKHGQVDLIACTDPIGAKGQRIISQIKHKGQAVTLEGVRSFLSILGPADFGVIVSMSGFTSDALQEVSANNFQKVAVLDAVTFFDLWKQHYDQLSQEVRYMLPLKSVHFLSGFE
jgi:restriction system protein